ncbi:MULTISPECIES: DNA cytosine methyltransferase [Vibrio harveyi group]|uniref:Cytosine-specific methyltransferase n=1 Tax=Vibrio campbellii TaxID=680 RepID=A0AAQ2Y5L8_9VIBR|nr:MULTISPECIES: DNA cytosine methyltransferase [Vibrio harveyi group]EGU6979117.1 DNA (cytosine-5-)-methyltransferase [Vibrio parahaemolyticus]EHE7896641.1 DNA cytosine methyltransferase [Vibrio parahaemolyticus]EIO2934643.1 DNA cytosine methyltransferase [Vibrio parahaemolyticus]EJE4227382.1 DNA cytosine methyltransferase [Vibrio parahaemolyticus]EKI0737075.1 DNA cytosine methyltransferase [Vibrio parahaemolyticus]
MTVKAIDLFAGAGGFTLSAIDAGVEVLAAIEFDKAAANTYKKNFIDAKKLNIDLRAGEECGDINNVEPQELRNSLGLELGDLDLILGGPPCQGFSTHRIKNAGVNDPRNALLLRYFEFVNEFKPKAFLVENVAGLLWKRHKPFLDKFIVLAEQAGYVIKFCDSVNAKDYGVPQNRKRVFIFGIREDLDSDEIVFPPSSTHFAQASGKEPEWIAASSVFEKIPEHLYQVYWDDFFDQKDKRTKDEIFKLLASLPCGEPLNQNDPCNVHMKPSDMMKERFADTPLNGSREDAGERHRLKCHSNGYKGHKDVYGRIFIHTPSNTITTGCNNPSKGRFVHPWEDHGMTLRHAARLQSFPDWFIFYGSSTEQARQIGNAVPPLLGQILISDICSRLN